jgi:hypothetical protein
LKIPREKRKKMVNTYVAVVVVVHSVNQSVTRVFVVNVEVMPGMSIGDIEAWGAMDGMWWTWSEFEVADGIAIFMSIVRKA